MQRIFQVLVTFLVMWIHAEIARAEIPVAIKLSQLNQPNQKIEIDLPGNLLQLCEQSDPSQTGNWSPNELLAAVSIEVTSTGKCSDKYPEILYLAAIQDLTIAQTSTPSIKVDSRTTSLELTLSASSKLPAKLSHVWLGGHKFALACSSTSTTCTADLTNSTELGKIAAMTTILVSVAHEDTVIYDTSGEPWTPGTVPLSTWTLPSDAGKTHDVVLSRTSSGTSNIQTEFTTRVPYWYLLDIATFDCKIGNTPQKGCGRVTDTGNGPSISLSEEAKRKIQQNTTVTFDIRSTQSFKINGQPNDQKFAFAFSLTWGHCAFQVAQLTPVSHGVDAAQVLLEITPSSPGCAAGTWKTASTSPNTGTVTDELRLFRRGFPNIYVTEVTTTQSSRSDSMPLTFAYSDGERVDTNQFELQVDGRVQFSNPRILVNTNVEFLASTPQPETFTEFEVTDTIAQSRRSLIQFSQMDQPEQWRLRLPAGVQVSRCPDGPSTQSLPPHVITYQTKGSGKDQWQGFCVDVERSAGRTLELGFERKSTISTLLDATQTNRLQELASEELFLGSAQETVQVKQAPFNVKVDLIPRVRLVCEGRVGTPGNHEIQALRAKQLHHCALLVELEDGALEQASNAAVPSRNLKGELSAKDERAKKEAVAASNTPKDNLTIDPCAAPANKGQGDVVRKRFTSKYGQQRLLVKLWEFGDSGEFAEVGGAQNTITIKWNGIEAGDYPWTTSADGGILAFCVDLTHEDRAAKNAYDVVKLTVEHDDAYYEVAWETTPISPFAAKVRRMPVLACKKPHHALGTRFFFSLAVPVMIRYPSTGIESETSSGYRLANAVAFQAGVVFGFELWNFSTNRPLSPIFNPQFFAGTLLLGLPTPGKPSPLAPSFISGIGFRLPSGDDASKILEASTSLLLWYELSISARGTWASALLFGFNVSIGFFGS
jgi:hypothetical protein